MNDTSERGLSRIFSDASQRMHRAYLEQQIYRFEALSAHLSLPSPPALSDICALRIAREEKTLLRDLYRDILAHRIFFRSFSERVAPYRDRVKKYRSESAFLYHALNVCRDANAPFCFFFPNRTGQIEMSVCGISEQNAKNAEQVRAIDLCEHAYFTDYGFDRERYLRAALMHLDLATLHK